MKLKLGAFCVFAFAAFAASAFNVSNKTVMVDQRGNLNAEGIASVQDVATNAVPVNTTWLWVNAVPIWPPVI